MHTLAWLSWVVLVMSVALITTNPFYLVLILLCVLLVAALAPRTEQAVAGMRALIIFGCSMLVISALIAVVNGNYGDHVLFTIPGPELPGWIGGLHLGGPVSGEGLAAALIRGLAILCVFLAFGVFNGAVSPHRVLRTAPAALFHAGLVVTVGLTLLPASIDDLRRIREMRALRGAPTGLRGLPGLVVPAVLGGLERSMRLAEAMEARGYAAEPATSRWPGLLGALSAPLLLAAAWAWFYYDQLRALAAVAAVLGVAAIGAWALLSARARRTTKLHNEPLAVADRVGIAFSCAALASIGVLSVGGWLELDYNPFAGLAWPEFAIGGAFAALTVAWPVVLLLLQPGASDAAQPVQAGEAVAS